MSTQQILRRRLKSVHNILHITQAMEVVAGVRFRKLINKMEHFRFYSDKIQDLINTLKLNAADTDQHLLFHQRQVKTCGVIVISGDKGLCGSYNDNILKETQKFIKSLNHPSIDLFLFGNKAIDFFSSRPWSIKKKFSDFSRRLFPASIKAWSKDFIASFESHHLDELWVVYTQFHHLLNRTVHVEKLLPLSTVEAKKDSSSLDFIFEPSADRIYESLIPYFFYTKLQSILFEAYASELSSRMIAMKMATKNAEEMIEKLTLMKNKNRQLGITKEILEITAGAEGLK